MCNTAQWRSASTLARASAGHVGERQLLPPPIAQRPELRRQPEAAVAVRPPHLASHPVAIPGPPCPGATVVEDVVRLPERRDLGGAARREVRVVQAPAAGPPPRRVPGTTPRPGAATRGRSPARGRDRSPAKASGPTGLTRSPHRRPPRTDRSCSPSRSAGPGRPTARARRSSRTGRPPLNSRDLVADVARAGPPAAAPDVRERGQRSPHLDDVERIEGGIALAPERDGGRHPSEDAMERIALIARHHPLRPAPEHPAAPLRVRGGVDEREGPEDLGHADAVEMSRSDGRRSHPPDHQRHEPRHDRDRSRPRRTPPRSRRRARGRRPATQAATAAPTWCAANTQP